MSEFYGEKPMPDWLREILVMCSGSDVAATLTDTGHAVRAGEVTPDDLIAWGGQIRRDVMTAMVQANIDDEACLPLPGESRKGDTAEPRVWRCDNGKLYRWSDAGLWETGGQWLPSAYDGPDEMTRTGLTLTEVPPAQSGEVES
jgi:hypothetical protein